MQYRLVNIRSEGGRVSTHVATQEQNGQKVEVSWEKAAQESWFYFMEGRK